MFHYKFETITPTIKRILLGRWPNIADWNCQMSVSLVNQILITSQDYGAHHYYVGFTNSGHGSQALFERDW